MKTTAKIAAIASLCAATGGIIALAQQARHAAQPVPPTNPFEVSPLETEVLGQSMHNRALALDMANRKPMHDQPLTLEVEDARGNKVFKKRQTLSPFGVASTDFTLADEVNMGTYTLRASLPSGQTEKKVRVER